MINQLLRATARAVDFVTRDQRIDVDATHDVPDCDPRAFLEQLATRGRLISALQTKVRIENGIPVGQVFPAGPTVSFRVLSIRCNGPDEAIAEVEYGRDFVGRGRITATRYEDGLEVRDQWLSVENRSTFPTPTVEAGHSVLVHAGFVETANEVRRAQMLPEWP